MPEISLKRKVLEANIFKHELIFTFELFVFDYHERFKSHISQIYEGQMKYVVENCKTKSFVKTEWI